MRPVIVAGNWKMNTTPSGAGELARDIAAATNERDVVRILFPPFLSVIAVRDALRGTDVAVGIQNVHWEEAGAYTGEVSALMAAELATWSIVGHSERRRDQGETDAQVGMKLRRCLDAGLRPILCVGERLPEREAGRAESVVRDQLEGAWEAFGAGSDAAGVVSRLTEWLVVAYEPVWAIGTGRTARAKDAADMAQLVRETLARLAGLDAAAGSRIPVLYGGSVTSAAIGEFLAEPAIDGALVGGASLKVDEMAGIVARAAVTARARISAAAAQADGVR